MSVLSSSPSRPAPDSSNVVRCPPRQRAAQTLLTLAVAVLLGLGAVVGDDHWYPVGPFRMFSTATPPDGYVSAMSLEGRVPEITADPTLLRDLAEAHARMHPADAPWTGVRVIRNRTMITDSQPTGTVETEVVSTWTAP